MANLAISYSGRDYTAEKERLVALLRERLPEWTDQNYSDPGVVITEGQSSTTDLLNLCLDKVFFELFLESARFRQNLIAQGRTSGYLPNLTSPANTTLQFTRKDEITGAIPIPQWSIFQRSDGVEYVTLDAVTMAADADTAEVVALQGTRVELSLSASDFAVIDRTRFPRKSLGVNVAAGTLDVSHASGDIAWVAVESFWRSLPTDYHYYAQLNGATDEVMLTIGDGTQGSGFPTGATMAVNFLRTSGATGNCGSGVITVCPDGLKDQITCTNTTIATGGAPSATLSELRIQIPACAEAQRRMTAAMDFKAKIEDIPGVLHCKAYDREDSPYWPHAHIMLFAVPDGGGPMTDYIREQIISLCCEIGRYGNWRGRYVLLDPVSVPVNISARIGVMDGHNPSVVSSALDTALATMLSNANQPVEGVLDFNEMQRISNAVTGLGWVEFDAPQTDVEAGQGQQLTAGTISITVV